MYKCKHFQLYELIDKRTFDEMRESAWDLFRPTVLIALDNLREFFNTSVTVNNWFFGKGNFQFRGFRPDWYLGGAKHSQHRLGNAFDCDIQGMTSEQARQMILAHKDHELLRLINAMESGTTWLHFDCRETANRIQVFHP